MMEEDEIIDEGTEMTLLYKCHACDEFINQLDWQHFEKCSPTNNVALYCVCGFVFPIDQHYVYHCELHRHLKLYNSEDILVYDAVEFGEDEVRNDDGSKANEVCANEESEEIEGSHTSVESPVREENLDVNKTKDTETFEREFAVLGNVSEVDSKKETIEIVPEVTEIENTKTCYDNDKTLEVKIETRTEINSVTDLFIKEGSQRTTNIEEDDIEELVEDERTEDNPLRTELKYEKYAVERDGETHKERDSTSDNADMVLHKPIEQEESMSVAIPIHSDLTVSMYNTQQDHVNPWSPTLVGFGSDAGADDLQYAVNISPRREATELYNKINKYKGISRNQVRLRQRSLETPRPRTTVYSWLSDSTWQISDAGMASQAKSAEAALSEALSEEDGNKKNIEEVVECPSETNEENTKLIESLENKSITNEELLDFGPRKANNTIQTSVGETAEVLHISESQIEIDHKIDIEHREQDVVFATPTEITTIEDNIAKKHQSHSECDSIELDRENDQTSVKMPTEVDNFEKNNIEEKKISTVEDIDEIGEKSKRNETKPTNEVANGIESLENKSIENEEVSNIALKDLSMIELVNSDKSKNVISDPRSKTDNNNDLEDREDDLFFSVLRENITIDDANEDITLVEKHYKEDEPVQSIDGHNEAPENTTKEISDENESRNGDKSVDLENENSEIAIVAPVQDLTNEDSILKIKPRNAETDTNESVIEIEETSVETSVEVIIIEKNEKENKFLNVFENKNMTNTEKKEKGTILTILHDQEAEITVLSVSPCNEKDSTNIENFKSSEEKIIESEEKSETKVRKNYELSNEEKSELLGTSELHITHKNIHEIIEKDSKLVKCDVEDEMMNDDIHKAEQNHQGNSENEKPEPDLKYRHITEQTLSKTTEEEHVNETKETEEKVIRETVSVTEDKNELRLESERNETIFTTIFNLIFKKSIGNLGTANGESDFDLNKEVAESKYIDNAPDIEKVSEEVTDIAMEEIKNTIEQVSGEVKEPINSEIGAETINYTNDQDGPDELAEDQTVANKITIINETVDRIGKDTIGDNKDKEVELNAAITKQIKHHRRRRAKRRKKIMKYIRKIILILGLIGIIMMLFWMLYTMYQKPHTILKTIHHHYEVSISNMYMYF